jgi:polyisoprenoid-binding protein YceI
MDYRPMKKRFHPIRLVVAVIAVLTPLFAANRALPAQELLLQLDPARSGADISLGATLHSVHGSFSLKRGDVHFNPATGTASGEIVFDATSGATGNSSRDNKMHTEVIQSQRYPEIVFRPDRAAGTFSISGISILQVHGMFAIHGVEHEVTFPVQVNVEANTWTAKASFQVPYVKWGMKRPSAPFLRVAETVQVQFHAAGSTTR